MGPVGEHGLVGARPGRRVPSPALTGSGWAVGLAVTLLILGTPYLVFGFHSPSMHLVLGSIDACVAMLVSYLVYGRFVRSRLLQDLLLAQGLFLLALAGLGLVLVLHLFDGTSEGSLDVWLPLVLRSVGALLIAFSALAGDRRTADSAERWGQVVPWALVAVAFLVLWLVRADLPSALTGSPPASAQRPVITGHPMLLVAQAVGAVCFLVASVAFTVRAVRRHDELLRWLGPACALGGFARVNFVLFPSLYSDWLYTGDLLRTGSYLLLLVGAAREISQYWSAQARVAVLEDRRRLARELHDGLVQEIAYIRAESRSLPASADLIVSACDRALDEARGAVDALARAGDEPLAQALSRAARQVAERYDARLDVEVDHAVHADDEQRHALVRIAREAVSNAVRHGRAGCVRLRLLQDAWGRRLVVEDDGAGFDLAAVSATATGYGLTSMRERARALPGEIEIRSAPGKGTQVWVTW
ncbi:MAG TPA: ATP-binding protein [Nocardioidaceae bacterium]|nr:ATP-binding protein [Nocardioidaceae bacterium]